MLGTYTQGGSSMGNDKRLLTIKQTAELLGIAPRTIYNQCAPKAEKKFPVRARRFGRKVLFAYEDVLAFRDSL